MSTKNNSKRPKAAEFTILDETPKKIIYGTAVVPFDENLGCWMLPAGLNQTDRRVKSATKALMFAKEIDAIISGLLRSARTHERGSA